MQVKIPFVRRATEGHRVSLKSYTSSPLFLFYYFCLTLYHRYSVLFGLLMYFSVDASVGSLSL